MVQDILMPQLGQAMTRGQIVEWRAEAGDSVTAGTHLLTIESDKFTYEIEAPATGTLQRLVDIGQEARVGTILGRIGAGMDLDAAPSPATGSATGAEAASRPERSSRAIGVQASPKAKALATGRIELADISPSRPDGLIVAADVATALAARQTSDPAAHGGAMERLQRSWQQAPHFVQMVDVDATALAEALRLRKSGSFPATLNDILIHVAAQALSELPMVNSRVVGGRVVRNASIDIALAVATERGLRTPTIRNAGGKPLTWIVDQSRLAIAAAKAGAVAGGPASITISNLGAHGIRQGTPVLNLDEAVLLFAGAIIERPVAKDGTVVVQAQMTLSIAYDHRVVDGQQAARFTAALRDRVEAFDLSPWRDQAEATPEPERVVSVASDGKLRCDLKAGPHRWTIDEPNYIGGDDQAADPVLHLLGALLSCLTIAFKVVAARRKLPIERISGEVRATPATGKVKQVAIYLSVWSPADPATVEGLLKAAKAACYVHDLLRPDLDLVVELSVHRSEALS